MLHAPHVLRKAQAEIESVVGPDRMPDFDDKERLPYIRAIVNETLRWRPGGSLTGVPHLSTADNEYNGM
jgi:cytochrome P450